MTESDLPTGTVTLLLGDVEGSTRLWEADPDAMRAAVERHDGMVAETIARHHGVRPVDQGEGDSFFAVFERASDAVACALDLQRATEAPLRLRLGIHTGEVAMRGEGNVAGTAVNRCARLRSLAAGRQTVVSRATHDVVVDRLPDGAWFLDLGVHRLRDLARPEHVHQLCHTDLPSDFPPLQSLDLFRHNLPMQLTSFVGRGAELDELRTMIAEHRLVTLVGSGGCGKTRLALQIAADVMPEHPDGVWQVDLVPVGDADLVPAAVGRALGLHEEHGRSTVETLIDHLSSRRALVVLDNCEHVIGACASLADELLRECPSLVIVATSREPLGVAGEVMWPVPSLVGGEAVQLFVDRAQRARPGFDVDDDATSTAVGEICARLDGIPLAIELAAARMRVLSAQQIVTGLQDRFRLLAGGARTAVPRQQTLRASVDWSHDLLTDPERTVFRRLAALAGTFDLDAAEAVAAGDGLAAHQVLDQLALLVDKSLVLTIDVDGVTRYRMLETVRQYALEKLGDSGEALDVRRRHRDHFLALAERGHIRARDGEHDRWMSAFETEIDNLRSAMQWSIDMDDVNEALRLAASLQLLWRRRFREGRSTLRTVLERAAADPDVDVALRIEAMAVSVRMEAMAGTTDAIPRAEELIALADRVDEPRLRARARQAAGYASTWTVSNQGIAVLTQAVELAREAGDDWVLADALGFLGNVYLNLLRADEAIDLLRESWDLAMACGNRNRARQALVIAGCSHALGGDLRGAGEVFDALLCDAIAAGDVMVEMYSEACLAWVLALMGEVELAAVRVDRAIELALREGVDLFEQLARCQAVVVRLAQGDAAGALAIAPRRRLAEGLDNTFELVVFDELALAHALTGGADACRSWLEPIPQDAPFGAYAMAKRETVLARIAHASDDLERIETHAHEALRLRDETTDPRGTASTLELLADAACRQESFEESARLLGAVAAIHRSISCVRFKVLDKWHDSIVGRCRASLGDEDFDRAWAEGEALSLDEAVAYARRGRGERKRPTFGWASLTPMERDVAGLVAEGMANKDVATKLFISPRTVQAHLTHIYAKLNVSSRSQLVKAAADRA